MSEIKRSAKRLWIKDILNSTLIKRSGFQPNSILTNYGEAFKVFIMGIVVSTNENSILVDDGSGSILIRFFEKIKDSFSLGDCVLVIGRVRESDNSKFIASEIIRKTNKKWFDLHREELKRLIPKEIPIKVEESSDEIELGPYQKVLNLIAILDQGEGVNINDIIENVNLDDCDEIINNLIEQGEIFEISPGKVKLLN